MPAEPTQQEHDAQIIARVLAGDEQSFRDLVCCYQNAVFACAYAITRNQADAADARNERRAPLPAAVWSGSSPLDCQPVCSGSGSPTQRPAWRL